MYLGYCHLGSKLGVNPSRGTKILGVKGFDIVILPIICFCSGLDICSRYPQLSTLNAESSILNTVKDIVGSIELKDAPVAVRVMAYA